MKTKIIALSILAALLFSPALNCAFAGDAFSQLKSVSFNSGGTFDGSKSYSSKIAPTAVKSVKTVPSITTVTDPAEPEKSSLWEKTKETLKAQKKNIVIAGVGAIVGFAFGGPAGAVVGAVIFPLFMMFLSL